MKGEIGLAGRLIECEQPLKFEEGLLDRGFLRTVVPECRKPGTFDFDPHAHFENVYGLRNLVADVEADRAEGKHRMIAHEDTSTLSWLHQSIRRKRCNGFAYHGTAHPKGFRQLILGRHLLAGRNLAGQNLRAHDERGSASARAHRHG